MLEARWETEQHNSSILYLKQAVLSLQVLFSLKVSDTPSLWREQYPKHSYTPLHGLVCLYMTVLLQEVDLAIEEEFANQLVSMLKSLPIRDIFQEATTSLAPLSLMHQESSQRALRVITAMRPQDNSTVSLSLSGVSNFL